MKGNSNHLVLFAASFMIAEVAPAQDASMSLHQEMLTNSAASIPLQMETGPKFDLGPNLQLTGLFVDCAMPQQTWNMLDPSLPSLNPAEPVPPSRLPVMPLPPISNPAVHEADFAVLRLSFP
ncbi:MAG TPA: hypothetical protein VNN22_01325 [Verrucomicrobiae bacterium]|nr:hypothetical protein [Verrucomicrobiae bacterium]